ncbi:glycosyltransferase family 4 protein [Xanthobacteraceae bacterium Astr-EGSB]|uniref:glycosyltransferase family 4 protein n=1 Tax=Astrobacterium formosum TaxID=3069710 RepID=UPI0027AEC54B|nr:glycosyltransferase family 4 protein [Xanthobacteraceae bacterium Astr-EGSB]
MTPPPRRILMTTDAVGGVWVYAGLLAKALCACGDEVTLAVMGPPPAADRLRALDGMDGLRVEITGVALEWMDPDGADVERSRARLLRLAEKVRPDIIHLNSYREAAFDWSAPVIVVAHSCVLSWWKACRGGRPHELRWDTYADAVELGLDAASAWVAPTTAFRDAVEATYHPRRSGRVIHNGIDAAAAAVGKEPFVLAAGRVWDEAKNLHALAAIAGDVDWPIRIAGETQSPTGDCRAAGASSALHIGPVAHAQLNAMMRRAGIFVAPCVYEPFGLSILEAAAAGCALVLAEIPTLRELWDDVALFVDPRRPDDIAEAVRTLCRNDALRATMGRIAAGRARRYSLQRMATAYRDIYAELCRAGAPAPAIAVEARP